MNGSRRGRAESEDPIGRPPNNTSPGGVGSSQIVKGGSIVNFGTQKKGTGGKDMTFTVRNTSSSTMNLGNLALTSNNGFTIVQQPAKTLAAGKTTSGVNFCNVKV